MSGEPKGIAGAGHGGPVQTWGAVLNPCSEPPDSAAVGGSVLSWQWPS